VGAFPPVRSNVLLLIIQSSLSLSWLQFRRAGREIDQLGIRLAAIRQSGHWRVEMKWPKRPSRYFGKFHSQSEAEEWIEAHCWMSAQRQEPDDEAFESLKDDASLAATSGDPAC
jgi:hypothetical protein